MLLDIKKLFTKGSSLGRIEYIKLVLGLFLFPLLMVQLAIILPPNNLLSYPIIVIALLTLLAYMIIHWVAIYKRLNNIFDNNVISVISLIVILFSNIILILSIVVHILLVAIPGKKKSDYIISNTLPKITIPLVIICFIITNYTGFMRIIPGEAMANTLKTHDRIILNIFDKKYHRGDIIIHKTDKKNAFYIKRIIALPGEKVEIKTLENDAKYVFINDKLLKETYVKDVYDYTECSSQMNCKPLIVPENNYYVLGDNRGNSYDSRFYGVINKDSIKGKVSHIWFPINRRLVFNTFQYSNPENN